MVAKGAKPGGRYAGKGECGPGTLGSKLMKELLVSSDKLCPVLLYFCLFSFFLSAWQLSVVALVAPLGKFGVRGALEDSQPPTNWTQGTGWLQRGIRPRVCRDSGPGYASLLVHTQW